MVALRPDGFGEHLVLSLMRVTRNLVVALALSTAPVVSAAAQVNLVVGGGAGTPLSITVSTPVTYTITKVPTSNYYFAFKSFGDVFSASFPSPSGSIGFQINGGATTYFLDRFNSGVAGGDVVGSDLYVFTDMGVPGLAVGDVITLNTGTLATIGPVFANAPASGSFESFIFNEIGDRISSNAVSTVPEPASLALMGAGFVGLAGAARRKAARKRNIVS